MQRWTSDGHGRTAPGFPRMALATAACVCAPTAAHGATAKAPLVLLSSRLWGRGHRSVQAHRSMERRGASSRARIGVRGRALALEAGL
eukprot:9487279-Pyramimonas_sp.AAC.1